MYCSILITVSQEGNKFSFFLYIKSGMSLETNNQQFSTLLRLQLMDTLQF
jgi:hypothetical protein